MIVKIQPKIYINTQKFDNLITFNIGGGGGGRTGLKVRASDSGSGDPGSILGRVGVLFP